MDYTGSWPHCKGASDLHTSPSLRCRRCTDWFNLLLNLILFEGISQTCPKCLSSHAVIPQMSRFMTMRLSLCPLGVDIFLPFHCFCRYPGSSRWGGTLPFHFLLEHIFVNGISSILVLSCLVVCTYVFYTMHRNSQYALTSIFPIRPQPTMGEKVGWLTNSLLFFFVHVRPFRM